MPSYDTISKVGSTATGNDALIAHDGLAVAIENAYSNGKTMYIALFGEYIDSDSAPDTLRYSFSEGDGSSFTVNGRAAELKTKVGSFFDIRYLIRFAAECAAAVLLFAKLRIMLAEMDMHYFVVLVLIGGGCGGLLLLRNAGRLLRNMKNINSQ